MAKQKKQGKKKIQPIGDNRVIELLEDIKKLTILQLVKGGVPVSTDEIGSVLGITGRAIRKIATVSKKPRKKKGNK
jgi:hypothetical protein